MPPRELTAAERRENVRRVKDSAAQLADVENALADMIARLPALLAQVQTIRTTIDAALSGARPTQVREEEKEGGDDD